MMVQIRDSLNFFASYLILLSILQVTTWCGLLTEASCISNAHIEFFENWHSEIKILVFNMLVC